MASDAADLVVVGGGLAGMSAAIRAAEQGLKPLVIEQGSDPAYLCNSRVTMGVFQVALHDMLGGADTLIKAINDATHNYVASDLRDAYVPTEPSRSCAGSSVSASALSAAVMPRAVLPRWRRRCRASPGCIGRAAPAM